MLIVSLVIGGVLLVALLLFIILRSKKSGRPCPQCRRVLRAEWAKCPFCNWKPSPRLEFLSEPNKGSSRPLDVAQITIGSGAGNIITIADPGVSHEHCEIRFVNGGFECLDFGSTNGVYINGERRKSVRLQRGDYIRCGNTEFRFWDE